MGTIDIQIGGRIVEESEVVDIKSSDCIQQSEVVFKEIGDRIFGFLVEELLKDSATLSPKQKEGRQQHEHCNHYVDGIPS